MIAYFADYISELVECRFPLYAVDLVTDFGWCCVEIVEMEDDTVTVASGFTWIQ